MERRLTFGSVAELYDRQRPSYPDALVTDVIQAAGGDCSLEIGAGTGKATVQFADHGVAVLALEPSAEMAALARRNCARHRNIQVYESQFEQWDPEGRRFSLVFSAQAFHWIDPSERYRKTRQVLVDGGTLAVFWTVPRWPDCELRAPLLDAYRGAAPGFDPSGPMHPAGWRRDLITSWPREIERAEGFIEAAVRDYEWSAEYGAEEYARLIQTHSDHIVLSSDVRAALLAAVSKTIERAGGTLRMPYVTRLCLARAG